ncbi:MAG: hypothetical protein ACYC0H_12495 [Solirubrobacteraceae bacterium]
MATPDRIAAFVSLYFGVVADVPGRLDECVADAFMWSRDLLDRDLVCAREV